MGDRLLKECSTRFRNVVSGVSSGIQCFTKKLSYSPDQACDASLAVSSNTYLCKFRVTALGSASMRKLSRGRGRGFKIEDEG